MKLKSTIYIIIIFALAITHCSKNQESLILKKRITAENFYSIKTMILHKNNNPNAVETAEMKRLRYSFKKAEAALYEKLFKECENELEKAGRMLKSVDERNQMIYGCAEKKFLLKVNDLTVKQFIDSHGK